MSADLAAVLAAIDALTEADQQALLDIMIDEPPVAGRLSRWTDMQRAECD